MARRDTNTTILPTLQHELKAAGIPIHHDKKFASLSEPEHGVKFPCANGSEYQADLEAGADETGFYPNWGGDIWSEA